MSSLRQRLAEQQTRVHEQLGLAVGSGNYTVTIAGTDYADIPVVAQPVEADTEDGLYLKPRAIHLWLDKDKQSTEPALRASVVWDGQTYRITSVTGAGTQYAAWFIKAEQHRG